MIEFLERERRDILTHMQAFPNDPYAAGKLAAIERDIKEVSAIPPMGHMVKHPTSPCQTCSLKNSCISCQHAKVPLMTAEERSMFSAQMYGSVLVETKINSRGEPEKRVLPPQTYATCPAPSPRYTFGADYEQDQLWLAAERAKMDGVRGEQRTVAGGYTQPAEPDKMMFPVMAYNLTSMHNLNYGTSRY